MRKHFNYDSVKLTAIAFLMGTSLGCKQSDEMLISGGDVIPITLTGNLSHISSSRVSDNAFEEADNIGLYVLETPKSLSEDRHVDNMKFKLQSGTWTPDETIYYPANRHSCDFIAYYPYEESRIPDGESTFLFDVKPDQSKPNDFISSDLLVALKKDVPAVEQTVALDFEHKLIRICIKLLPGNAFDTADELLAAHPTVLIKKVCNNAIYDPANNNFSTQGNISDVIPFGDFAIKDNAVIGKQAIIVPQTIEKGHIFIELKIDNRIFNFTYKEKHSLESNTIETVTLTLNARPGELGTITTQIKDWENSVNSEGTLEEGEGNEEDQPQPPVNANSYAITLPDFAESYVYKAMNGSTQIAEICKEYLHNSTIDYQAIVIYPVENKICDFTRGYIAQLLENGSQVSGNQHGGTISWNRNNNTFSYQAGDKESTNVVYINEKGEISATDNSSKTVAANIQADIINDIRDGQTYPITKISTQYWMAKNLHATTDIEGTTITKITENSEWTKIQTAKPITTLAYSLNSDNNEIYYNYPVISSNKIAPEGWSVPTQEDWTVLKNYLNNNSKVLKSSSWENGGTNLTGFSSKQTGNRNESGDYRLSYAYYWYDNGCYTLEPSSTDIKINSLKTVGCTLRCIKK